MACPDCTQARSVNWHGLYRSNCTGCSMRAFARSSLAFEAVRDRSTRSLRQAIADKHPSLPLEDALRAVWDWWAVDHPAANGVKA